MSDTLAWLKGLLAGCSSFQSWVGAADASAAAALIFEHWADGIAVDATVPVVAIFSMDDRRRQYDSAAASFVTVAETLAIAVQAPVAAAHRTALPAGGYEFASVAAKRASETAFRAATDAWMAELEEASQNQTAPILFQLGENQVVPEGTGLASTTEKGQGILYWEKLWTLELIGGCE